MLQYDHGLIRQVVDVLGEASKQRTVNKHVEEMEEIVGFLDRFMDGFHHMKEERFVFPVAVENGSLKKEDLEELVAEHEEARTMIASLREAFSSRNYDKLCLEGRRMADHMQAHVRKEEDIVFPRIEDRLSPEQDGYLNSMFEDFMTANFPADLYPRTESFANWVQDRVLGPGYFEYLR